MIRELLLLLLLTTEQVRIRAMTTVVVVVVSCRRTIPSDANDCRLVVLDHGLLCRSLGLLLLIVIVLVILSWLYS